MTGTRAPLEIVSTHRDHTPSGKVGCVTPADSPAPPKPKILDQLRADRCAQSRRRPLTGAGAFYADPYKTP